MFSMVGEFRSRRQRRHCFAGTFYFLIVALSMGPMLAPAQTASDNVDALDLNALIGQLGTPSFREREQASRLLVERGLDALPTLRTHYDSEDQEVRERVRIAIQQIREIWKPNIIELFATSGELDPRFPIPGWLAFKELLGDTPEARRLMAGILQQEWNFLEEFELREQSPKVLVERCSALQRERSRVATNTEVSRETIAAILLAASELSDDAHRQQPTSAVLAVALNIYVSNNTGARGNLANDGLLRALVAEYLDAPVHAAHAIQKLQFAAEYNFAQAAPLARQVLEIPGCMPSQRHLALIALGRFGTQEDLPMLELYLDDDALAFRSRTSRNLTIQCQIRDAALFAAVQILKLPPEQYGIPAPPLEMNFVEFSRRIGFPSDSERKRAFDQWKLERSHLQLKPSEPASDASDNAPTPPN
jgi:hypothetical protein